MAYYAYLWRDIGQTLYGEKKLNQLIFINKKTAHKKGRAFIILAKNRPGVSSDLKEESKVANCDSVDHQACSLLQYINVITNLLITRNNFKKLC